MTSLCLFLIVSDSDFTNNFTSIHLQLFYPNDTYNLSEPSYILYSSQTTHYNKPNHTLQQGLSLRIQNHSPTNKQSPQATPLPLQQAKPPHKTSPHKPSLSPYNKQTLSHKAKPLPLQQANPHPQSQALPLQQAKTSHTKAKPLPYSKQTLSHKAKPLPLQQASLMLKKHSEKQANPAKNPQYSTL